MFAELLAIQGNDVIIQPAHTKQQSQNFDRNGNKTSIFYVIFFWYVL